MCLFGRIRDSSPNHKQGVYYKRYYLEKSGKTKILRDFFA